MQLGDATFDLGALGALSLRLVAALVLALPIGWERELASRSAGLRTFPLVALAACGYVLVALAVVGPDAEAQSRVLQGLMTGIGFIGGGAILKSKEHVHGTATAAGIWVTGAIGAAAAYGRFGIAVVLTVMAVLVLGVFGAIERRALGTRHAAEREGS
ncbi:MAG TPA: MgtC/SapB family protein [Gemmatimonadaceae bacterium]